MNRFRAIAVVALLLIAFQASAQEVGTVAAAEESAEIGRGGTWTPATTGAAIHQGDELRTGPAGRLRIVFQDDSVLTLDHDSVVTVDESVFRPADGDVRSYFELIQGKVNSLVSEYYKRQGAAYEVKTKTAVAGVRGTEFSVNYDPRDQITEVIGFSGEVTVHGVVDPTGPGVIITANEATTVADGELPTPPRRYNETFFRQQLEGFDFVGAGRLESLTKGQTLSAGAQVPEPDRAPVLAPDTAGVAIHEARNASDLIGDSPAIVKAMTGQLGINLGR